MAVVNFDNMAEGDVYDNAENQRIEVYLKGEAVFLYYRLDENYERIPEGDDFAGSAMSGYRFDRSNFELMYNIYDVI